MDAPDLYRRLQQHLDRMPVGFPATESGVEIRLLQRLFTPEEAEVALEVSAWPEKAKTIHRRLQGRLTLDELRAVLEQMARNGVLMRAAVGGEVRYGKLIFAVGIYERQLTRLTPEFERDVREYLSDAFSSAFHTKKTGQMRTVPVRQSIPLERNVATYDDLRGYVAGVEGPFAKMECICRKGRELTGEKCRQTSLRENCLTIGRAAESMTASGAAQFIAREEMLDLLDAADREGLVLQPENSRNPMFVCCCCGCCCNVLTSAKRLPCPGDYFHASYIAEVAEDACSLCASCEARCQMEAVTIGEVSARVDKTRCIGCGLCVTTCPSGAMVLKEKPEKRRPPLNMGALYAKILAERYGAWGAAKMAGQALAGRKV
jgi:Pyruvate/2-oxoacid:ferredoxin oxidoreductase delta subunit